VAITVPEFHSTSYDFALPTVDLSEAAPGEKYIGIDAGTKWSSDFEDYRAYRHGEDGHNSPPMPQGEVVVQEAQS
jgi:hypothetical protein